jgi:hypothetical protein
MLKPPTGEPCAGEPNARFGGRGGGNLPDPYRFLIVLKLALLSVFSRLRSDDNVIGVSEVLHLRGKNGIPFRPQIQAPETRTEKKDER